MIVKINNVRNCIRGRIGDIFLARNRSLNETMAASYMSSLPYPSRIKSKQIDNTHQTEKKQQKTCIIHKW